MLNYKTRENANPKGKPRVYFCCHPNDFQKYFESISDEILSIQNCSIWYPETLTTPRDTEYFDSLRQMQLFVMPVTTLLLRSDNVALNSEFKFAIKNHIPVLPLMQESGLEGLFNQRCGDLQYLDKYSSDKTAISYKQKLENYLSSVLIGDELAQQIRAAFDAYVFLSYRKKDRKYAQELMHLIHRNSFCRDIAIWYDEFLTPGENFNDAIQEALLKSGLFVLTVTPNLVNETNYIMTTEYPMAQKAGKLILPIEMVPTDPEQLSKKYHRIPLCTDAHDHVELSQALLESIRKMALKKQPDTPEHTFFIGLAYLAGIDVEIDSTRALTLITSAAESGLTDAIKKLIDMYQNGIGVAINHKQVIHWQIKLIENYAQKILARGGKSVDFDEIMDYINSLLYLGTKYYDVDSHEEAIRTYETIMDFAKKFSIYLGENSKIILSACYNNLGVTCSESNQPAQAVKYYEKAVSLRESLVRKHPEAIAADLLDSYINLAICYDDSGNTKKGVKQLNSALKLYESQKQNLELGLLPQARIYQTLGSLYYKDNPSLALQYYNTALSTYVKLMEHPTSLIKENYADVLYNLGILYQDTEDYEHSEKAFIVAHKYYSELAAFDPISHTEGLINVYYELAYLYRDTKNHADALQHSQNAILYCEQAHKLGLNIWLSEYRVFHQSASILMDIQKFDEALPQLQKAEKSLLNLEENHSTAIEYIHLYNSYGRLYYRTYKNKLSQDYYHKSFQLHNKYYTFDKDKLKDLGIIYYNVALLCYHNYHDKQAAREMINKAIKAFAKAPNGNRMYQMAVDFKHKFLGYF